MSDADCTPGREPHSIAASLLNYQLLLCVTLYALTWLVGWQESHLARKNASASWCQTFASETDGWSS